MGLPFPLASPTNFFPLSIDPVNPFQGNPTKAQESVKRHNRLADICSPADYRATKPGNPPRKFSLKCYRIHCARRHVLARRLASAKVSGDSLLARLSRASKARSWPWPAAAVYQKYALPLSLKVCLFLTAAI